MVGLPTNILFQLGGRPELPCIHWQTDQITLIGKVSDQTMVTDCRNTDMAFLLDRPNMVSRGTSAPMWSAIRNVAPSSHRIPILPSHLARLNARARFFLMNVATETWIVLALDLAI